MTINFQKATSIFTTNWLVKPTLVVCYFTVFTFSCKNPEKISLERQVSENPAGVFYTDTFQVNTETILIDTPSTKNKPHLLVGKYLDAELGTITCETFTELNVQENDSLIFESIDSVTITFNYDFYLGNTSKDLTLQLEILNDSLRTKLDYNRFSFIEKLSGTAESFTLKHQGKKTFRSLELKNQFELIKNKNFYKEFKGISISSTSSPGFAIGLGKETDGLQIKIYTKYTNGIIPTVRLYNLVLSSNSKSFTNVKLEDENPNIYNTNHPIAYLNEILGIGAKISIPGINAFIERIKGKYIVTEASFQIPSSTEFEHLTQTVFPAAFLYETKDGKRFKNQGDYQIVQREFTKTNGYIKTSLDSNNRPMKQLYSNSTKTIAIPFTLHLQGIASGKFINNPFILAEASGYIFNSEQYSTQSPFTYSFLKGNAWGKKIQFVVYYNKIVK